MVKGGRRDLHGDWSERQVRKAYVDAWVEVHGYVCPGWNRGRHASMDLTADHPVPVARGGQAKGQPYLVLCRSCNGRKGARTQAEQARTPEIRSREWL